MNKLKNTLCVVTIASIIVLACTDCVYAGKIEYEILELQGDEYVEMSKSGVIEPEKTALVLIDIWPKSSFNNFILERVNPIIKLLRDNGVQIIHSPSGGAIHGLVDVSTDDAVFYGWEKFDDLIEEKGINTLIYGGYDAFWCVLDKPNGILRYKERNKDVQMFIVEDLLISSKKEMKRVAINLMKKIDVGEIDIQDLFTFFEEEIPDMQEMTYGGNVNLNKEYAIERYVGDDGVWIREPFCDNNTLAIVFMQDGMLNDDRQDVIALKDILADYADVVQVANNRIIYDGMNISVQEFFYMLVDYDIEDLIIFGNYLNEDMIYGNIGLAQLYIWRRYGRWPVPATWILEDYSFVREGPGIDSNVEKMTILNHYRLPYYITSEILLSHIYDGWGYVPKIDYEDVGGGSDDNVRDKEDAEDNAEDCSDDEILDDASGEFAEGGMSFRGGGCSIYNGVMAKGYLSVFVFILISIVEICLYRCWYRGKILRI